MKSINKRKLAGFLAACMVTTILPPAMPVFGGYQEPVGIYFVTGDGPSFRNMTTGWNSLTEEEAIPGDSAGRRGTVLKGNAGIKYTEHANSNNAVLPYTNESDRPDIPGWDTLTDWDYTFGGWYPDEGPRLTRFTPPAFPYNDLVYTARWIGNSSTENDFTIIHKAELGSTDLYFYGADTDNIGSTMQKVAGNSVNAAFRRNIPGYSYVMGSVSHTPERARKYGESSDTLNPTGTKVAAENSGDIFRGTMPNDPLTVTFTYEPDPEKASNFIVRHETTEGISLFAPNAVATTAGTPIHAEPKSPNETPGYIFDSVAIISGEGVDAATEILSMKNSGVYSLVTSGGEINPVTNIFDGKMPNQKVEVKYTYKLDPNLQATIEVIYRADNGDGTYSILTIPGAPNLYQGTLSDEWDIPVPDMSSEGYDSPYVTSITNVDYDWIYDNSDPSEPILTGIKGKPQVQPGKIIITYPINYSDTNNWALLKFRSGLNGNLQGDSSGVYLRLNETYDIDPYGNIESLPEPVPIASPNYKFDGWYRLGAGGALQGSKLSQLEMTGDMTIIANFVEDPDKWVDVKFVAPAHSTMVPAVAEYHIPKYSNWSSYVPTIIPDTNYLFEAWYDDIGNEVVITQFDVSATYTARVYNTSIPGYDALNRPNAQGSIGSNGTGMIRVRDVESGRNYIITDIDGNILHYLNGTQINGGSHFTDLAPGTGYHVYEAAQHVDPAQYLNIRDYDLVDVSRPAVVVIPAVEEDVNAAVESDPANEGQYQIVISPAAPNTEYALITDNGQEVYGWTPGTGNPSKVVFDNLNPDEIYIVVARPVGGSSEPADEASYGTAIHTDADSAAVTRYQIQIMDGTVKYIIRDGNRIDIDAAVYTEAKAGDKVFIDAEQTRGLSETFKEWKVIIGGNVLTQPVSQREREFTMPEGNIVLLAVYTTNDATPSNASVSYRVNSGQEGKLSLDLSYDKRNQLSDDLTTSGDETLILSGTEVEYVIQLTKRASKASESNAVKDAGVSYPDSIKAAWSVEVEVKRFVDGYVRQLEEIPDLSSAQVIVQIDAKDLGQTDYELWELTDDGSGGYHVMAVPMNPNPANDPDESGIFWFTPQHEAVYVLTYSRTNTVTIKDTKGSAADEHFRVGKGESLSANTDYRAWSLPGIYVALNGEIWIPEGLSSKENKYQAYDDTSAVTKDQTIYIYYKLDQEWKDAKDKLDKLINEANNLINGDLTDDQRNELQDAINRAEDTFNQYNPGPTTDNLKDVYNDLKNVVDSIKNIINEPDLDAEKKQLEDLINEVQDYLNNNEIGTSDRQKLEEAIRNAEDVLQNAQDAKDLIDKYNDLKNIYDSVKNKQTNNNNHSNSSGGGSSKTSAGPANRTKSYIVGTDGNWEKLDESGDRWAFVLTSGSRLSSTWAYIHYTHEGTTTSYYYYFDSEGIMKTGWFYDTNNGHWYYLSTVHDGWFGHMKTGWHHDLQDQRSYYLDTMGGHMHTGWKQIDSQWYYFSPLKISHTWGYNEGEGCWEFLGSTDRPYGSMYTHEETPDGFLVDSSGVWSN